MFGSMMRVLIALGVTLTPYLTLRAQSHIVASIPVGLQTICFTRGEYIYLRDLRTGNARRVLKGHDPNLSPSGRFIAFTADVKGPDDPDRTIKVLTLETNQVKGFESLTGYISYGALWSVDESKLAFHILAKKRWHVGILNPASGEWRILTEELPDQSGTFLSSWVSDGKSIVCHDLTFIYEIDLDGKVLQKIPVEKLVNKSRISSATKFSLSQDRRYLLFDTTDSPVMGSIYVYDFLKEALIRVTPEEVDGTEPQWLPTGRDILFTSYRKVGKCDFTFDMYKISVDGSGLARLLRNASSVSYSTR